MAQPGSVGLAGLTGTVDFALAFAVVHETPSARSFFAEVGPTLKPGAGLLLVEPSGHVKAAQFEAELAAAARAGLTLAERLSIRRSHATQLKKASGQAWTRSVCANSGSGLDV